MLSLLLFPVWFEILKSSLFLLIHFKCISAPVSVSYKEIAPVDKKKIQEEIESVPKPTHLLEAQRELLSFTGLKPS